MTAAELQQALRDRGATLWLRRPPGARMLIASLARAAASPVTAGAVEADAAITSGLARFDASAAAEDAS